MDSEKEEKEIRRLSGLVNKAVQYRQQQRDDEYINNEASYEGLQWQLSSMDEDSPFIVKSDINHLANAVDNRFGSLYANSYYGELKPLSMEDVEIIEDLQIIYKNEWFRLNTDHIIEDVIKAGGIFDNGYVELNFDTDAIVGSTNTRREGAITLKQIDTTSVYLDPSANSIDNCDYMVKKDNMTIDKIKRIKPDWYEKLKKNNIEGYAAKNQNNGSILAGRDYTTSQNNIVPIDVIYEKYVTEVEVPIEEEETVEPTGANEEIPTQEGMINEPIVEEDKVELTEKIRVERVKISYLCKDVLLEVNTDYPFEEFPIIPFQWKKVPQSPYGTPLLRGLTVPQKVANLIESSINNIAVHYTVPTWLISDESGLDVDEVAQLINALGVVWKVTNIDNAIKQLEPPKLNKDIISMGQTFVNYIKEYAGVTSAYSGDIGTAGSTAQGTADAIGRATIIDNEPIKQITDFVERLTRLLIKFMVRYYAGDTIYVREEKGNGKYDFKKFVMDTRFDNINYDFDVDLGSRSKNDKNRQYNLMKEIYQLQNQYKDQNPVINVTDVVKAAQLDNYNEMKIRLDNVSEESLSEKANLVVQLVQIGNTITPNGEPLIPAELLQEGIMDVLNDDNDLTTAESIIQQFQEYQQSVTDMKFDPNNQQVNDELPPEEQENVNNTQM